MNEIHNLNVLFPMMQATLRFEYCIPLNKRTHSMSGDKNKEIKQQEFGV